MAIIIPCAGKSSRFPNTRPKYLLTMHDGELMVEKAIKPHIGEDVHVIILKEHDEKYNVISAFERLFKNNPNVKIHLLDDETSGPAETVYTVTKNLDPFTSVFIKDCDSFFCGEKRDDNHVCIIDLRKNLEVKKVAAKSFAMLNNQMMLTNIVEKSVVSNYVCAGGYGFSSAKEYNKAFEEIQNQQGETFVSHVIKVMLETSAFVAIEVTDYVDVGTYKEFIEHNQSIVTLFCDIDGTVFYNQSKYFENNYSNTPIPIDNAVKFLLKKQDSGSKIFFTTSRSDAYREITEASLDSCGFKNYKVIYDLPHSPRVMINDYSPSNPYPTAIAINVPRDHNEYWESQ